ncbi:MAG: YhdP family protein [Betaproteobacteria bacterium]
MMPVANDTAATTAAQRSRAARLVGLAGTLLATFVILACAAMLAVRYLVLPQVASYRIEIAERLSREIGAPVTIGAIDTGWDGWNPQVVVTGLSIRDKPGDDVRTVLALPRVSATISWLSLAVADVRMKELVIEKPDLTVTRLANGRVRIAGFEIDPGAESPDTRIVDWILRQREIVVHDALVTWNDERRGAPQLLLDRVEFRLEHPLGSRRHRFGLTGRPPAEVAAPIDVRGEFVISSAQEWSAAGGRMYLRLDYADLAAWAQWLPLPVEIDDGRGAVRLWLEYRDGAMRDLTADVALVDVKTRLDPGLPWLELARVDGRLLWHGDDGTRRVETQDLSLVAKAGAVVTPMDFTFEAALAEDGSYRSGRASADVVELAPLAALATSLPMPAGWRADLARYAPRGTLRNARYRWEGPADKPASYAGEADAQDIGVTAAGTMPGFTGLTGKVQADERGGSARVGSKAVSLLLPRVFAAPLAFDSLAGNLKWRRSGDEVNDIEVDGLAFANTDAAGTASGTWRAAKDGAGTADVTARLTRADARGLPRYLPLALSAPARDWLRRAIGAATSDDVRLTLKGDLDKFPFADPKQGTFVLALKARNGVLDYAEGWPAISDIEADVRVEGTKLAVDARHGRVYGAQIGPTKVAIADLSAPVVRVVVEGEASGPTTDFLQFIAASPLAGWTGRALDTAQATGNGRLKLRFELPLGQPDKATAAGEFNLAANTLRVPGVPPLAQIDGRIAFDQNGVNATDLAAEVFGGPAKLSIASVEGGVRVSGRGNANVAAARAELPEIVAERIAGSTDWALALEARAGRTQWTVDSTMRGVSIDLPAPIGKAAAETLPLRIERRPDARGTGDSLTVDIGRVGRVLVARQLANETATVERVLVLLGRAVGQPASNDRAGIWVRGDVAAFNLDDWLALKSQMQSRGTGGASAPTAGVPTLRGVDLEATMLQVFGRRFNDAKTVARSNGDDWRVQLTTRESAGTADWRGATPSNPNGRLVARLTRMSVPDEGELTPWQGADPAKVARGENEPNPWPELDVKSEALFSKGRDLGRLELVARPQGTDWRIEKMTLASDAGQIHADGLWRAAGKTQLTRLDVSLDAPDAGAMLKRFGFADVVRAAPTKIKGQLEWPGAPSDYEPTLLSGSLSLEVGAGQFTKIEPGIGKLLGVLSLQALPRRITLDFRDVFSEGFAFDTIEGKVRIARGVMTTEALRLVGPAARVDIVGDADLAKETQELNVRVLPSLSSTFSTGAAGAALLLLAANPLVAAAVGAGTLLAQKVMKDPFEQMFSYEYRVTGSWSDPVVARVGARPLAGAPVASSAPAAIVPETGTTTAPATTVAPPTPSAGTAK